MVKRCVIKDCSLEHDLSQFFPFPKDLKLLDQWISKLPLINLMNLDFKEAVLCESHFNPKELIEGVKFNKELIKDAVPEYFPENEVIDRDSCRFCFKKVEGVKLPLDNLIQGHYQNLMQEELSMQSTLTISCGNCYNQIRNSSFIKSKIQENQNRLLNLPQSEFLEIKMETYNSDEEMDNKFFMETVTAKEEQKTLKKRKEIEKRKPKKSRLKELRDANDDLRLLPRAVEIIRAVCQFCEKEVHDIRRHIYMFHKKEHREMKAQESKARLERRLLRKKINRKTTIKKKIKKMCLMCNKDYENLPRHIRRIHQRLREFQCDICPQAFFTLSEIRIHMRIHEKYRERKYICHICTNSFLTEQVLKFHIEKYHLKRGLVYCETCGESFVSRTFYENHVRSKHTGERPWKCDKCAYATFTLHDLKRHLKNIHLKERFYCCKRYFRSERTYNDHLSESHRDTSFECSYSGCGRVYSRNDRLKEHVKVFHLQIKDYKCQTCGEEFSRKNAMDRHILTTHMKIKFNCEAWNCKAQYGNVQTYRSHVQKVHQNLGMEVVQKLLEKVKDFEVPNVKMS